MNRLRHRSHAWSFLAGGGSIGVFFVHHGWALILVGFLLGLLAFWAFRTGGRVFDRLNRALPDHGAERHCEQCGETIHKPSRARFCSVGCREYAAKARRAQQFQSELDDGMPL